MTDTFTRDKLEWTARIATDGRLSHGAARLGTVLALQFLNRTSGKAFPSQETLAGLMNVEERSVRRFTAELVAAGHLTCHRGGKGRPNEYRLSGDDRTPVSAQGDDREDTAVRSKPVRAAKSDRSKSSRPDTAVRSRPSNEPLTGQSCPLDRTNLSILTGQPCPTNPLNEPFEEPSERYISPRSRKRALENAEFDKFWQQYPRRVARGAAIKAFRKAREIASLDDILAGALRYSAERQDQDPTYTKHPATWLNAQGWLDEPQRPHESPMQKALREIAEGAGDGTHQDFFEMCSSSSTDDFPIIDHEPER